jgi:surface antigen
MLMKISFVKLAYLAIVGASLTACSSINLSGITGGSSGDHSEGKTAVGGKFAQSMDEIDQSKLSHALDNGLGKSTQWTNAATGVTYTVVPTKKITLGDNPYCREYTVTSTKGGSTQQVNGTACLGKDASWRPAG